MINQPVVTKPFSITPSQYIGRVMSFWFAKWGWILLFPFCLCGMLAFFRWEWLIVALILLLIIYPFILVMLYFMYGLTEEGVRAVKPRQVCLNDGILGIRYLTKDDESDTYTTAGESEINFDSIKSVSETEKGITIRLKGSFYKHLFVPDDSLGEQRNNFTTLLKESGTMFV